MPLRALAAQVDMNTWPAPTLMLLASALDGAGDRDAAVALLRRAAGFYADDVWINYNLAMLLEGAHPPRRDEAIRYYTAAHALQPGLAHELAHALEERGETDEAIATFQDLNRCRPDNGRHLLCLGRALESRGRSDEARRTNDAAANALRAEIRQKPGDATPHIRLGLALWVDGQFDAAIAEQREAIRLNPSAAAAHNNLGLALKAKGQLDAAIAAYREAIRLGPEPMVHNNLAVALREHGQLDAAIAQLREVIRLKPDSAKAHANLGLNLSEKGQFDAAIAEYKEALRLKPDDFTNHTNLGLVLLSHGQPVAAIAELRTAIRLNPNHFDARIALSNALVAHGEPGAAIAELREAIRLKPNFAQAHSNLGIALRHQGNLDEANAAFREAIRLNPEYAAAHLNLGLCLREQGYYAGSLAELRISDALGSKQPGWPYSSADLIRPAEQLASIANRLPAILSGDAQPRDHSERLVIAQLAVDTKRYAAAARLWSQAFEFDPKLAGDLQANYRYNAACVAALAGCGKGRDGSLSDEPTRAKLRKQALAWLKADARARSNQLASSPPHLRPPLLQALEHWKVDADLAGVRDSAAVAQLPESERSEWQSLWKEVDQVLEKAAKKT